MNKHKIVVAALVAGVLLALVAPAANQTKLGNFGVVSAEDDWKVEFESVCARTRDSMTLDAAELRSLVERCDKLKPRIEQLDETQRKVFLRRLQMCRDLFAFVLESKEKK